MPDSWIGSTLTALAVLAMAPLIAVAAPGLSSARDARSSFDTYYGTLQSQPERAERNMEAGITMAQVGLAWSRYEPREGEFDQAYVEQVRQRIEGLREAGMKVSLGLGVQYPPAWIFEYPHSRYINQYGDAYNEDARPGTNGVNAVFNQAMRDRHSAYFEQVFKDFDADTFHSVRLGGGYYGELSFPTHEFNGQSNAYWAFDPIAQGDEPGLPDGIEPSPAPGWKPGDPSPNDEAARFADWYVESLGNYHDWQIQEMRRHYDGWLVMLYPSWGLRMGQLEAAVAANLDGSTPAERNGETQRAHEFHRFIANIDDAGVVVCTTWLDSDPTFGNDDSDNPVQWSPGHYLASLAYDHPLDLPVWAENTGNGQRAEMELSFERMRTFGITGLFWAFEPQLYDDQGRYADVDDYADLIQQYRP